MSAFDVAGAVVWTPLAGIMWWAIWSVLKTSDLNGREGAVVITVILTLASAFCIARLFGATL